MKPRNADDTNCRAISSTLQRVGDKWTVLVIAMLGERTMRFSELRREIGDISQKMLTTTLRGLEEDGFVTRTVYPTIPPKVEYALTDLGRDLLGPVNALIEWAKANSAQMDEARNRYHLRVAAE